MPMWKSFSNYSEATLRKSKSCFTFYTTLFESQVFKSLTQFSFEWLSENAKTDPPKRFIFLRKRSILAWRRFQIPHVYSDPEGNPSTSLEIFPDPATASYRGSSISDSSLFMARLKRKHLSYIPLGHKELFLPCILASPRIKRCLNWKVATRSHW